MNCFILHEMNINVTDLILWFHTNGPLYNPLHHIFLKAEYLIIDLWLLFKK